jgi:hypothetical protein
MLMKRKSKKEKKPKKQKKQEKLKNKTSQKVNPPLQI